MMFLLLLFLFDGGSFLRVWCFSSISLSPASLFFMFFKSLHIYILHVPASIGFSFLFLSLSLFFLLNKVLYTHTYMHTDIHSSLLSK